MLSEPVICSANINIIPILDCIAPPFTSKILKYIIESSRELKYIKELLSSSKSFKPIVFTPLLVNGRPLYSRKGNSRFLELKSGTTYNARISFITSNANVSTYIDELMLLTNRFKTPYGEFHVQVTDIEVVHFSYLHLDFDKYFKIRFITPVILTNKLMMPPPLKVHSHKVPERHRLIPTPSYIFNYLIRLWNSFVPDDMRLPKPGSDLWAAYKFGRISDIILTEVDYSIRPETVIYGKTPTGKPKLIRGFTGWITYELLYPKLKPIYSKLLALAKYMGIGRSRSIGFGQVEVYAIK